MFFTAGYTELNAMKSFMRKINDGIEYIQLCPIGPRKSKRAIQTRHIAQIAKEQNGMTGEKLIDFAADFIGKRHFEEEGYEAILIEDDKDGRFLSVQEDGTAIIDENEWDSFKNRVMERLNKIRPGIPIVFSMLLRKSRHGFWQIGKMDLAMRIKAFIQCLKMNISK